MSVLDSIPLWQIMAGSVIMMVLFIEIGLKLAKGNSGKQAKAQAAQVRAIMGASLGLLAFMLAFSFSMAQRHFESRTQAYMLEISAIDSAFRGADLLDDTSRDVARNLLAQFTQIRLDITRAARDSNNMSELVKLVKESEQLHDMLWSLAESSLDSAEQDNSIGLFAQSVLAMINAHDARLQAGLFNRISPVIWLTLFVMALLSMVVMGFQAGLTGARSAIATWTLAITFSAVMALVTDLDRPNMSLFSMNQQLMQELHYRISGQESNGYGLTPQE